MDRAILTTARLILEPMAEAHFEDLARLRGDPDVMAQMQFGPETRDQARATFEAYRATWRDEGFGAWAILDAATRDFIGETGLRRREDDGAVALRISLHTGVRGRGLAGEAVAAVLGFAFERAGLDQVTAVARRSNADSVKVLLRAGFTVEREFRKGDVVLARLAIDAADWRERRRDHG